MAQEYYNQHSLADVKVHFPSAWFYSAKYSLLSLSLLLILFVKKTFCSVHCPLTLTLNIPSLARQRYLSSWGPRRTPWFLFFFFFVISQLFDAVDYSNYVFWVSETIIQ